MTEEGRPDPRVLLRQVEQAEEQAEQKKGRLKIFFGYAAGVGKTYAMLEAAHAAKKAGIDVVAGYIEPHTRPETSALLKGLECLPPKLVEHKGITLREFDLDLALKRHPSLILVDELAHTNAEVCRHRKRYQDIEELLAAGIDVYTTVNVQHIESLNDIVASFTGVTVRERIPDKVFDNADQVELVDIEPEELMDRLHAGKIYKAQQAQRALGSFFIPNNLIALREIALRRTADRVNRISEKNKQAAPDADYYTGEHILICLSASPSNAKVIRTAARMANAFKADFTALFVETPDFVRISSEDRQRLRENLKLAEQLGAKIDTVYGDDIPLQIAEYARTAGISKIVLGRSTAKRRLLMPTPSFSDRLTAFAPNLDIYIIPDKSNSPYRGKRRSLLHDYRPRFSLADTLKSLGFLAGATLLGYLFDQLGFSEANIITVYILGVLLTAVTTTHKLYSLVSSILSVLIFNFFFTEPRFTLNAYDQGYPVTFLIMFLAAFITGTLTRRVKQQARRAAQQAYRTQVLLETSQKLQSADTREAIIDEVCRQLVKLLNRPILFYDADESGLQEARPFPLPEEIRDLSQFLTADERAVAQWVYKNNKRAGATTNTLPGAKCLYFAVRGPARASAVVGIVLDGGELESFETNLLGAVLGECALALEKDRLDRVKRRTELAARQEQLRADLLRAISHDLRTPLTSISGNAGILLAGAKGLDDTRKHQLYTDIYDDSMWLINLVENLLSVTRIEDGTMNIHMEPELLEEVIGEALRHIHRKSSEHTIRVKLADDLMMARMDSRLIIQVIINIVDNAIKYTPPGSTILLSAHKDKGYVVVEIADNGAGIADEAKKRLFDMFFTASKTVADSRRSLGLGLALCKSIISAHGGTISVEDNRPHGAIFRFTLLAEEVPIHE